MSSKNKVSEEHTREREPVRILARKPDRKKEPIEPGGPVTYELVTRQPLIVANRSILQDDVVGEVTIHHGLDVNYVMAMWNRYVYARIKS